jgi:DNA-binding MarR family transcriptional regulator
MNRNSPIVEPNRCNCAALRKASRRLSQFYDSALAASGLKSTQFAILAEIERRTDRPPTIRELAEALVMDQSTVGQNLRPLERDGLVSLEQDAADRRRRHVKLTREGVSQIAVARPLWLEAQSRFEDRIGEQAATDLRAALLEIARDPSFVGDGDMSARIQ